MLEYQYAREMRLRDIGCVQLHYTAIGIGDIISNFTFRYPPRCAIKSRRMRKSDCLLN